jgi:hypothetical protein
MKESGENFVNPKTDIPVLNNTFQCVKSDHILLHLIFNNGVERNSTLCIVLIRAYRGQHRKGKTKQNSEERKKEEKQKW